MKEKNGEKRRKKERMKGEENIKKRVSILEKIHHVLACFNGVRFYRPDDDDGGWSFVDMKLGTKYTRKGNLYFPLCNIC